MLTAKALPLTFLLLAGCSQVDAGHLGVVTMWGEIQDTALAEGLHATMPLKTQVINISTRVQKKEARTSASSKDLQVVRTNIALNYRLMDTKIVEIFRDVGDLSAVNATIIEPALQEAIKKATAQYTAEQLITRRQQVKESITMGITTTLAKNHVLVTEISITDFQFDTKYQNAVEAKQVAEQEALTAENDLKRIKVEAQQALAKADGEAKSTLLKAEAEAKAQALIRETVNAEIVYLRAIEKWDGHQPTIVGDGAAILDLGSIKKAASRGR